VSNRVRRALNVRVLVFVFVLAISLLSLVIAPPGPKTGACPEFVWTINYYTDNTYTVLCGQEIHPCCGGIVYHSGCKTAFRVNTVEDCP
jgi:hypothetical protein